MIFTLGRYIVSIIASKPGAPFTPGTISSPSKTVLFGMSKRALTKTEGSNKEKRKK